MASIVVAGAVANKLHNGGEAWVRLSWARGLARLGHEVLLLEQLKNELTQPLSESASGSYFHEVCTEFGFDGRSALLSADGGESLGLALAEVLQTAQNADLLINISGHLTGDLRDRFRRKAFIDLDPVFTQVWHRSGLAEDWLLGHDTYFTIGENIGRSNAQIPDDGLNWIPVRQPVVLEDWPASFTENFAGFTTVATWRTPHGRPVDDGRQYGMKLDVWREFIELPTRTGLPFATALDIAAGDNRDRQLLTQAGWSLQDPGLVATPKQFRSYIQNSSAEFSPAQGAYVETRSGWFSDRSVRYLASGKPVVVSDTGIGDHVPVGDGLLTFRSIDQAIAATSEVAENYVTHAKAARALAEEFFDSDDVLRRFLDRAL